MFCTECGETVQPGTNFCGSCGNEIGTTASAPASEPDERPAWLNLLFVLWAFVYAAVGAGILFFLLGAMADWLGFEELNQWLMKNLISICVIIGLVNALIRGVAAARRM